MTHSLFGERLSRCLIEANHLPPDRADTKEGGDVENGQTKTDLPPSREGHIAGAEERRRRANSVVGGATHDVAEDAENESGHQGRSAARDKHGEEGGVHGADVRGTRGEHVVGVEVQEHDHKEGRLPREAGGGDDVHDGGREPGDETVLVQVGSHGDESGEPGEGVPGGTLGEALLPGDDTGDEEGGKADERSGDRANTDGRTEDPETNSDSEGGSHDLLVTAHGAELFKLLLGLDGGFGGVLDLRRVEDVEDERDSDEADNTRNGRSQRPLAPGDGLANGGGGKVHGQGVSSHRSDEHAGGDGRGLEDGGHHVRAHLLLSALVGLRAARDTERLGERKEDTTRTSGKGGDGRGEERLRKDERVRQTEGGLAEHGHDDVRDAVAEARLDEAACEEERKSDKPGNLRGEGAEGSGEGKKASDHRDAETDHGGGAEGKRLRSEVEGKLLTNFPTAESSTSQDSRGQGNADSRW